MNTQRPNIRVAARILFLMIQLFIVGRSSAQTYYDMSSGNYSQTFTAWAGYPNNWNAVAVLATGTIPAATKTTVATTTLAVVGTSTAIGYDAASSTKLVFLTTGATDNTSAVATDLNLNFTGRTAGTISFDAATIFNSTGNRNASLRVYYTSDNGTSWSELTGTNLPYVATNNVAGSASISVSLPATLSNKSAVTIRFYNHNGSGGTTGSRPKISLDNLTITSTSQASPPSTQVTGITFSAATSSSVTASWTNGNGDGRVVKINTTNSFTDPVSGQSYTANAIYSGSGEQVISSGTSSSATVSNLIPGQTYYFRAYEYLNTGTAYNVTTTTGNPASVTINYPVPSTSSITPTSTTAGGPSFTLTVSGSNFYSASVINWNGSSRTTTYVNSSTLTAIISTSDISSAGTANVTVSNPLPGGGVSGAQTLTINPPVSPLISVVANLSNFTTLSGTPSSSQSYSVSGSNLTGNITITPPSGFEIRTGSNSFSNAPIVLSSVSGSVISTTIDIRFNPASTGSFSGSIIHSSVGAADVNLAVNGFALASEPITPSTISFGTISGNSIVVNTAGGSGTSRIIVIRQASAVSFSPTDGQAVTGVNSIFTSATDQGSGNKIVYDGAGNTVAVTGLSANTVYYFTVFEYNGNAATSNYQLTGAGTATTSTIESEPTTSATVTLTRMKTDSSFISFAGGNGTGRIVILSTSSVSFVPVDGLTYTGASSDFTSAPDLGSGNKLIFSGSATTTMYITGLAAGTTYYLRSYEYNGLSVATNYRTSTFGSTSFTTPSNISYTVPASVYTQDFNGLPSTGTMTMTGFGLGPYYLSTPAVNATSMTGWQHSLVGGTSPDIIFAIDNGASTSGGEKSYGATSATNRSLGSLAAGTAVPVFGAIFVNNTGGPLTTLNISYKGQQWRNGGSGTPNVLSFSYALNGTSITNGSFTPVSGLNFTSPISSSVAGALDGTLSANQTLVSNTVNLSTNWMPGQTLVVRWTDNNDAGSDDGLAIDDFTFSAAGPQAPSQQDSLIAFINVLTTSMDVFWQPGNGTSRILLMNTTNNFVNPSDGNSYTANSTYSGSGQQVVYDGQASVVHIDGLTPGTTYYFRAYGYNGTATSIKYSTVTATDNPNFQSTVAPSLATQLVFTSVNGGADPVNGTPFNVTIQSQDASGNPQTVNVNTAVALSISSGYGTLSGTLTGTILAGTSTVTITGISYSPDENFIQLQATTTSGQSLLPATSNTFNVLGVATQLVVATQPSFGVVNQPIGALQVQAYRADYTIDNYFTGVVTITKATGPGTISGTLTVNCVGGIADFTNVVFSQPGTYTLTASATGLSVAYTTNIVITLAPTFTELIVPKYLAGKTSASAHNARVPFAICIKLDNLYPNTAYDLKAGIGTDTTANTTYGSGNVWTGSAWAATNLINAFTTDANGSSGPVWIYIQPTANSTNNRFAPGQTHNIRIGFATNGGVMPSVPSFVGTKLITGLDISSTAYSTATTDDGAFVKGSSLSCIGGKMILMYDNINGTGDPIAAYQSRNMSAPNTASQSDLPTTINDVYLQTSTNPTGDYGAVVPIGANNTNGIRRIEVRNMNNTLFNVITDADGNWGTGANTSTLIRRDVAILTLSNANLNTIAVSATATGESCTGAHDGTASATATSNYPNIAYSWNTTPAQSTAIASGLGAGVYVVTATDNVGCTATAGATVTPPAGATITASGPTTFCSGGSVTLTASQANSYLWSNGATTQSITVSTSGTYSVILYTGSCNVSPLPVTVVVNSFLFSGALFSENMGSPASTTAVNSFTGWQNTTPVSFNAGTTGADVRTTAVSSGYTGASGSGNIYFGTTGGNLKTVTISGINTSGFSSLSLSFGLLRSDLTNGMTVEASTDGITFTGLSFTQPTTANSWQLITINSGIPSASNLRLRFSKNATTAFRLDDVKISGTTTAPSTAVTGSTSVCGSGSIQLYTNIPSGIVWTYNGSSSRLQTISSGGTYSYTATGSNGCTAASTPVVFTINPEPTATITAGNILCNGGTATVNVTAANGTAPYTNTGAFNVAAGTYSYIVTDAVGCDDTVSITVTQPSAITGSASVSSCGSYFWSANSQSYTSSGTYNATLPASNGCDSSATLNLTITPSTTNTTTATACDIYVWSYNGQTYTASGTYSSVSGCHTQYLNLTVTPSTTNTTTATACDSYVWSYNGQTYNSSGTYSSVSGCHTQYLNLTITPSTTTTTSIISCTPYTWSVTGQTYSQSGSYSSVNGCNTQVLSLTINNCNTGITLNLIAYIQGYYSGAGEMTSAMLNQGVNNATAGQVDTIIVELRDILDPTIVVDHALAMLMTDGTATMTFTQATIGSNYWIVFKHRNALQTWSESPVTISASTSYDFSTADTQAYGSNLVEVESGVWAIYSGDINQDEFVDSFDFPSYDFDNLNFSTGYLATDMNGDGFVDSFDFPIYDSNNINFVSSAHP